MSHSSQTAKPSLAAQFKSWVRGVKANAKSQAEQAKTQAKSFDKKHPRVKRNAIRTNRVLAFIARPALILFGGAAIVTAGVAVLILLGASVGTRMDMSLFWKSLGLTALFTLLFLWISATFKK